VSAVGKRSIPAVGRRSGRLRTRLDRRSLQEGDVRRRAQDLRSAHLRSPLARSDRSLLAEHTLEYLLGRMTKNRVTRLREQKLAVLWAKAFLSVLECQCGATQRTRPTTGTAMTRLATRACCGHRCGPIRAPRCIRHAPEKSISAESVSPRWVRNFGKMGPQSSFCKVNKKATSQLT
jgi:hypothetical protein